LESGRNDDILKRKATTIEVSESVRVQANKEDFEDQQYLLDWQDIENFVPPLLVFGTAVNKKLFVND